MTKTISILGCGWLGLPLGESLARHGFRVKGSSTSPGRLDAIRGAGIEPFLLSLDPELSGDRPEEFLEADVLVVNIPPGRRREDVETYHPRQIRALVAAIERARERRGGDVRSDVPFVIFVSSTSVYPDRVGIVREDDAGDSLVSTPPTASGRALLAAESILRNNPAFQTSVVRFGGLIGGDRNPARFLAGKRDVADPDAPVNLIHRDDCIGLLMRLIEKNIRGETFNACCDVHPTKREFYTAEAKKLGLPPPTFVEGSAGSAGGKIVSSEKIKRVLGYEFIHSDPSKISAAGEGASPD